MKGRDRQMADAALTNHLAAYRADRDNCDLIGEIAAAIAAARAEGDQAGYERGRREAIEECAALVNPGCWPTQIHRECAEEVNDAIRALAEPTTQPES